LIPRFLSVLAVTSISMLGQERVDPNLVREIQISFVPWNVVYSHAPSAKEIRRNAHFKVLVTSPWHIEAVLSHLPLDGMAKSGDTSADLRLVIDVKLSTGKQISYSASRFYFYSQGFQMRKEIGPEFKNLFSIEGMPLFAPHQPNHLMHSDGAASGPAGDEPR
jgi:hypothetical protein